MGYRVCKYLVPDLERMLMVWLIVTASEPRHWGSEDEKMWVLLL